MVNCLLESPFPPFFKEDDEILLCVVAGRAGLVAPGEERPEARLGCFNCPGRTAVADLKGPLFPGSAGRALMEAQGVYLSLFAEKSLKGAGIGQWCSRARPEAPTKTDGQGCQENICHQIAALLLS